MANDQSAWKTVTGRKRTSVFNRLGNGRGKAMDQANLEKIVVTIYVANFPSHLTVRELWNLCSRAGTVTDVYIGKNRNKQGQMYAFVRFANGDPDLITKSLCTIRIGDLCLHANQARHPRQPMVKQVASKTVLPNIRKPVQVGSRSYAKLAQGAKETVEKECKKEPSSSVIFADDISLENAYPFALLGCYKDFRAIANTLSMCQGEGFLDVRPVYLGGLWVLFDFVSLEVRDKFLNHAAFKNWFDVLQPWFNKFVVNERILWVEVEGVPILAWSRSIFEKIAAKWGKVIFFDDSDGSNRFNMRLGILTMHAPLVFESIFVNIQDVEYCVRVRELSSWTPSFLAGFSDEYDDGSKYGDGSHVGDEADFGNSVQEVDQEDDGGNKNDVWVEDDVVVGDDSNPFNLGPLINKVIGQNIKPATGADLNCSGHMGGGEELVHVSEGDPSVPPGFESVSKPVDDDRDVQRTPVHGDGARTPPVVGMNTVNKSGKIPKVPSELVDVEVCQAEDHEKPNLKPFSIVEKLDSAIAVGLALGWDMSGCIRNLTEIIAENGASIVHQ